MTNQRRWPASIQGWYTQTLPPTLEQWVYWREFHFRDGKVYRVFVVLPKHNTAIREVVYALDGEAVLENIIRDKALQNLPCCIVAISHALPNAQRKAARAYDFTPPIANIKKLRDPRIGAWYAGGAADFLGFLVDELRPRIEQTFALHGTASALFGHSYGGLFVVHALRQQPPRFLRYIAASPSLWWHKHFIIDEIKALQADHYAGQDLQLHVLVGEKETWHRQPTGPDGRADSREHGIPTAPAARTLIAALAKHDGISARLDILADGHHANMLTLALRQALCEATESPAGKPAQP